LVALVVALAFLHLEGPAAAAPAPAPATAEQRRREVRSLLRRLNKPPLATIQVHIVVVVLLVSSLNMLAS
jgi:hypothetical protein